MMRRATAPAATAMVALPGARVASAAAPEPQPRRLRERAVEMTSPLFEAARRRLVSATAATTDARRRWLLGGSSIPPQQAPTAATVRHGLKDMRAQEHKHHFWVAADSALPPPSTGGDGMMWFGSCTHDPLSR